MPFTKEDKTVIKVLRQEKGYGAKKCIKEFPDRNWSLSSLNKLLKKIDQTTALSIVNRAAEKHIRHALLKMSMQLTSWY